jgi:ATP-dependent Lon protease
MPILLLGDPGVGKTYFAKELSKVLQTSYEFCSFATMTASWILTGSASSWKDAKMGKVANVLIDKPYANPVIVLDELDKATGGNYDPTGALYQLFERETAQEFKDEFLDIEMDASRVTWVCTANDVSRITSPILSRMQVYEIPSPTPEQARHIAQRMYGGMLKEHTKWAFESELHDDALEALSRIAPREMKKKLLGALGEACLAHRDFITADDFGGAAVKTKQSIGFL